MLKNTAETQHQKNSLPPNAFAIPVSGQLEDPLSLSSDWNSRQRPSHLEDAATTRQRIARALLWSVIMLSGKALKTTTKSLNTISIDFSQKSRRGTNTLRQLHILQALVELPSKGQRP